MNKKLLFEIIVSILFVFVSTFFAYKNLAHISFFWNVQFWWSVVLACCWVVVAAGYYHQGFLVRREHTTRGVSLFLPVTVFFVQCILFVKGVYYSDWSLVLGAVVVNSGVVFHSSQILRVRGVRL